jgi:hypothetical protein
VSNEFEDLNSLLGESAGGSEAARAFRKQLILQGEKLDVSGPISTLRQRGEPREEGNISSVEEARVAERRIVSGRAKLVLGGGSVNSGKMVDISTTGACVMMDDQVPAGRSATLECDIFMEGKRYVFSLPVVTVYGLLARGKGFKIGLRFGAHGPDVAGKIEELLRI